MDESTAIGKPRGRFAAIVAGPYVPPRITVHLRNPATGRRRFRAVTRGRRQQRSPGEQVPREISRQQTQLAAALVRDQRRPANNESRSTGRCDQGRDPGRRPPRNQLRQEEPYQFDRFPRLHDSYQVHNEHLQQPESEM